MKPDDPRKHHFCPQFYLSNFTHTQSSTGRLHVYDKTTFKSRYGKPKNEAHQKDFYRITVQEGGDPFVIEREFSKIEDGAKRAIDFIKKTKTFPTGEDGNNLLNFVGLLAVRTPSHRNKLDSFHQEVMKRTLSIVLAKKERWDGLVERMKKDGKELPETSYDKVVDIFDKGQFTLEINQTWFIHLMLTSASTIIELLGHRNWSLVFAEEDDFVCSDNPVSLTWIKDVPGPYSPGFGLKNTQVCVPLTNKIGLIGVLESGYGNFHSLEKVRVAAFNNNTIRFADRYIYSIEEDFTWYQESNEIGFKEELERMIKKSR